MDNIRRPVKLFLIMDRLIVSNDEPFDFQKESLHVELDLVSDQWHFDYYATPFKEREFVRRYPAEQGIEKLDNFIKMIRW